MVAQSLRIIFTSFILISIFTTSTLAASEECGPESESSCINKSEAVKLKIIAIVSILLSSIVGVSLPLVTRSIPAFSPDKSLFTIVKAFSAGIILATGFMHVLPDSFDMLSSSCLPENPWHKFPFTGFAAMLSALVTLMVDSLATAICNKKGQTGIVPEKQVVQRDLEMAASRAGHFHGHGHILEQKDETEASLLLRYRVIAMVLELGIVVHSVVIGLSLGATNNTCTIKGLVAALCFHQMFEGMGLGGCIIQAEYNFINKATMVFFFSVTTPLGIAIGIALSNTYRENSPQALITVGLLNASSAGLLVYMALVDLLAADFMGAKMQESIKLQIKSYVAVLLGAGGMSLMAKWA